MIPAHLHNLTDVEFVRQFDNTDDPVLKEALRRIEVLMGAEDFPTSQVPPEESTKALFSH